MTEAATKAEIARKATELAEAVNGLKDSRVLAVHMQNHIGAAMLCERGAHDLNVMDEMRAHMKRSMAHQLADELIRSGAVKFEESLIDDIYRYSKSIRITARIEVC